jgi:methylmalonyl-CoA mutase N-terminal domain/subunit
MNHFMEIAKMRAGRMIWAKLVKLEPKDDKSLAYELIAKLGLEFNGARSF